MTKDKYIRDKVKVPLKNQRTAGQYRGIQADFSSEKGRKMIQPKTAGKDRHME